MRRARASRARIPSPTIPTERQEAEAQQAVAFGMTQVGWVTHHHSFMFEVHHKGFCARTWLKPGIGWTVRIKGSGEELGVLPKGWAAVDTAPAIVEMLEKYYSEEIKSKKGELS